MERLQSLIHRLNEAYISNANSSELLLLTEEIKTEITQKSEIKNSFPPSVSVWVPSNYSRINILNNSEKAQNEVEINDTPEVKTVDNLFEFEPLIQLQEEDYENVVQVNQSEAPLVSGAPRPPLNICEESTEINETKIEDFDFLGNSVPKEVPLFIHEFLTKTEKVEDEQVIYGTHEDPEGPVIYELDLDGPEVEKSITQQSVVQGSLFEEPVIFSAQMAVEDKIPSKPKELHEILASRVVAKPGSELNYKKPLGDAIGGGKISDLRKAISINDKFRFIKSLFRSDETLFERSVKTINNFSILPEAQYWIQRELVIKLGWVEEDELVQEFYSLVSRRFL
jgi:hypothetical protein